MRSIMSGLSKRELLGQVSPRYRDAIPREKRVILDEFVAATGYARKYAIRLLGDVGVGVTATPRLRKRRYGKDVEAALLVACLLYTSPSPRDRTRSRMPSSA